MFFASAVIPFNVVIISVAKKIERLKLTRHSLDVCSRCVQPLPPGGGSVNVAGLAVK